MSFWSTIKKWLSYGQRVKARKEKRDADETAADLKAMLDLARAQEAGDLDAQARILRERKIRR